MSAASILAVVVGGYFLLVGPVLDQFNWNSPIDSEWALVLLAPAMVLGMSAARSYRSNHRRAGGQVLGALALTAVTLGQLGIVSRSSVFAGAILLGILVATMRWLVGKRHRGLQP